MSEYTITLPAPDFALDMTLESGQIFRWWPRVEHGNRLPGFTLQARERVWAIEQHGAALTVHHALAGDAQRLRTLFGLDTDLPRALDLLAAQGLPPELIARWHGLRVCRQDLWEALICFTCSSATNVPRIRKMVDALCRRWGRPIAYGDQMRFAFPEPGALGREAALREAGLGYRAAYVDAINRQVTPAWLRRLGAMPTAAARDALMALPGVGEKVADCVLLFGLGRGEAFPVDVHVRRAMTALFFGGTRAPDRALRAEAVARFGPLAGLAQQVLFHEWRTRRRRAGG